MADSLRPENDFPGMHAWRNTPSDAETLAWVRDRELIRDLPQRYAHGIDTDDWQKVASVFHSECQVEGTLKSAAIRPYLETLEPGVKAYAATLHFMGNQYVELSVDGDPDRAYVETYAVAYHIEPEDSPNADLVMGVRYCDTAIRVAELADWRIIHRSVIRQWHRGPFPRPS
jgi:hypothetical protein